VKISIFKKQILFSHKVGVCFLIPKTSYSVKIYPTRIELINLEGSEKQIFNWDFEWPVEKFMATLDLEKERVELEGKSEKGFFRFWLFAKEKKILLSLAKGPKEGVAIKPIGNMLPKDELTLINDLSICKTTDEKLSFGSHKALDVEKIEERKDLKEIFPLLFSLEQKINIEGKTHREGMAKYLDFPEEKKALEKRFIDLFTGGFSSFVPKLTDSYRGYLSSEVTIDKEASPLILLKETGKMIRSLFFTQEKNHLFLLPKLLQPFTSGRMIGIDCKDVGRVDFEWSERRLRKVIFTPKVTGQIVLHPPKDVQSFRLRCSREDRGKTLNPGDPIDITELKPLFFDRFEK